MVSMTAINPTASGYIRAAAAGSSATSTPLNYAASHSVTDMVVVQIGTGGAVTITNSGGTIDLAIDLIGYYVPEITSYTNTYVYNADGLRTSKTTNSVTSYYIWDNSQAADLLADGTYDYIYGPASQAVEEINTSTGTVTTLHHDQLGSVRVLANSSGSVIGSASYDAFGKPAGISGVTSNVGFVGEYVDTDSGLIYLRNRYYDPLTAQFTTVDPDEQTSSSAYGYVSDDPLNDIDPLGLCSMWHPTCLAKKAMHAASTAVSDTGSAMADAGEHVADATVSAGSYVWNHRVQAGIILGGVALAATGVGAAADLGILGLDIEGTALAGGLDAAAAYGGMASAAVDAGSCVEGDIMACGGAIMGIAGMSSGFMGMFSRSLSEEWSTVFVAGMDAEAFVVGSGGLGLDIGEWANSQCNGESK
jgi:RHS repeat-associated protein